MSRPLRRAAIENFGASSVGTGIRRPRTICTSTSSSPSRRLETLYIRPGTHPAYPSASADAQFATRSSGTSEPTTPVHTGSTAVRSILATMSALLTSLRTARVLSTSASPFAAARSSVLAATANATQRRGLAKLTLIGNLVAAPQEATPSEGSSGAVSNVVSYVVAVNHNVPPGSNPANSVSFFRVACLNPNERRRAALLNVPKG